LIDLFEALIDSFHTRARMRAHARAGFGVTLALFVGACELAFPIKERADEAKGGGAGSAGSAGEAGSGGNAAVVDIACGATHCPKAPCCAMAPVPYTYECKPSQSGCTAGDGYRCDDRNDCSQDAGLKLCCGRKDGLASYCNPSCDSSDPFELCDPSAPEPCSNPAKTCLEVNTSEPFPPGAHTCQ
jgi:hypothetical protein